MVRILMRILKLIGCTVKWVALCLLAGVVLLIAVIAAARTAVYCSNHITAENGVDEAIYVPLGGQEQYLLIRGEDISNPVIIWLHGGPSGADAYGNHVFQKYLVEDYTIVNWDQRGCGRTYFRNAQADPENKTATFDQAQADLDELVDYVCTRFGQDRVVLIGHSYGTMLGSKYALDHPEKVSAYIGVGQVVSLESEIYSYQDALAIAKARGDDTSAMEQAYQAYLEDDSLVNMMQLRACVSPYHIEEKSADTTWTDISSPYMGLDDVRWMLKPMQDLDGYFELNKQLYDYAVSTDIREYGLEYQMPVGFISGGSDWTTPVKYTQDYHDLILAPRKQIQLLDGCGHFPQYDSPEEFSRILKTMLAEYLGE